MDELSKSGASRLRKEIVETAIRVRAFGRAPVHRRLVRRGRGHSSARSRQCSDVGIVLPAVTRTVNCEQREIGPGRPPLTRLYPARSLFGESFDVGRDIIQLLPSSREVWHLRMLRPQPHYAVFAKLFARRDGSERRRLSVA